MYAAILFDLDNTLIDRDAAFRALIRATFGNSKSVLDELAALDEGGYGNRLILSDKWQSLGGTKLDPDGFGIAISRFIYKQPDLLRSLLRLSEMAKLAIVSNGSVLSQMAKWRAAGLDSIIPEERLLISEAVGCCKPDPRIFRVACDVLSTNPKDCLFVGDQPHTDIVGAESAGLSVLLTESPLSVGDVTRLHETLFSAVEC